MLVLSAPGEKEDETKRCRVCLLSCHTTACPAWIKPGHRELSAVSTLNKLVFGGRAFRLKERPPLSWGKWQISFWSFVFATLCAVVILNVCFESHRLLLTPTEQGLSYILSAPLIKAADPTPSVQTSAFCRTDPKKRGKVYEGTSKCEQLWEVVNNCIFLEVLRTRWRVWQRKTETTNENFLLCFSCSPLSKT